MGKVILLTTLQMLIPAAVEAGESWREAAPMPVGVQEIYADVLDGRIYVGGGIPEVEAEFTDQFTAYDPAEDAWSVLAPVPERRHHLSIAAAGSKIYAFGGFSGTIPDWVAHDAMYVYAPESDSWSEGVAMTVARAESVTAVVDDKIYVIGGRIGRTPDADSFFEYADTKLTEVFDPEAGRWSRLADAPTARNSQAAVVIDGKVYVVGGRQNQLDRDGNPLLVGINALEVYDPATDSWEGKAALPLGYAGIAAAALDGKLYVFGGEQWFPEEAVSDRAWVYDPKTDRWAAVTGMTRARHGLAAASVGSEIFLFGGAISPGVAAVDQNQAFMAE